MNIIKFCLLIVFIFNITGCSSNNVTTTDLNDTPINDELYRDTNIYYDSPESELEKFTLILEILHTNYVDENKASYKNLIDNAIKGMTTGLDPYTKYFNKEENKENKIENTGIYGGINVYLKECDRGLEITKLEKGGAAEKVGCRVGDIIIQINSKIIDELEFYKAANLLRGNVGEKLKIRVYRKSDKKFYDFELKRNKIVISPIKSIKILDGVGYVKLNKFSKPAFKKFQEALTILENKDMKALIIDLRNNPGGYVEQAIKICSLFIETKKLIVTTVGRNKKVYESRAIDTTKKYLKLPIVILTNKYTASAAEIVTACLKDYGRAVIVGEKTYGKCSVQTIVNFNNKEGLKLTFAKYLSPNNDEIDKVGLKPDIPVTIKNKNIYKQVDNYPGVIKPENGIKDTQLKRAIEILKANLIYKTNSEKSGEQ
jgi:carboxyl-terminal processing protease